MGRPKRPADSEDEAAREVYARDRSKRNLRLLPEPRKRRRGETEATWAAKSGPVRVRRAE